MDIAQLRLQHQQLAGTHFTAGHGLLRWFGAVQGQEYGPTKWSFGLRMPQLADADIERDLAEGRILRTHLLRPTWHFVAAEDLRWLLLLTAPRVHQVNAHMYRRTGLDTQVFLRCQRIIVENLEGNRQLTRDEINLEFRKNGIVADGPRLSYIMMWAELEGVVCDGLRRGKQFTYALLEERVPAVAALARDEALAELAQRYFQSRGPATLQDFSTWSGLTVADCRRASEMLRPALILVRSGKQDFYALPAAAPQVGGAATPGDHPLLHLLPLYDEYVMGYKDRSCIWLQENGFRPATALRYPNLIIFNGQVIGSWRRTLHPRAIDLEHHFLTPPTPVQLASFEKAVDRFALFNGLPVTRLVE